MMQRPNPIRLTLSSLCALAVFTSVGAVQAETLARDRLLEQLGEALFHDGNLSLNRSQSCASCHDPERGFSDARRSADGAFSLGDDGRSLGNRNAPTASYAAFIPPFHQNEDGKWIGGLFWDGRAADLEEQAGGPPLNPVEMGLPDKAVLVQRLRENPAYAEQFSTLFTPTVLQQDETGFTAMTQAIAAFERRDEFAPFSSKYDRYLAGKAAFSKEEELGRTLFFSDQFTNCNQCHQLRGSPIGAQETFTDYSYHNIGVPRNPAGIQEAGMAVDFVDDGLLANPQVTDPGQRGKFRTPTLRNVAVTGPYMHNGVFQDLRTVVLFYNRYNSKAEAAQMNPETGQPWGEAPVPGTLSVKELTHGPALDAQRVDALVAFLKTLTDQRYEDLLDAAE
ncbi:cytochrome-c peroxidase [Pseudophaeobacter arcticus]|uniref:cytochrome-c peroxidase n=1 Tax=Pseudophaeobacter arcticus TaxID=385492 RepID=UPI0004877035|nr:cytochrome c peroxidase [Pseudophaeobacter arcticus]